MMNKKEPAQFCAGPFAGTPRKNLFLKILAIKKALGDGRLQTR